MVGDVMVEDYASAQPETFLSDLAGMAAHHTVPIAVVDDTGRLVGVVPCAPSPLCRTRKTTSMRHSFPAQEWIPVVPGRRCRREGDHLADDHLRLAVQRGSVAVSAPSSTSPSRR